MKRNIIKSGGIFTVYQYDHKGPYFVDLHGPFATGYDTLQGVAEFLYYQGMLPDKTIDALNNFKM